MTSETTNAMHASVTFLTYLQLTAALKASTAEQDARFSQFLLASDTAIATPTAENKTAMNGEWAGYKTQQAMTGALLAELEARMKRGDYA